jgi:hypothetical protein
VAKKRSILERVPLAPVVAVLFGAAAAILVAATPQWMFEAQVAATGLGEALSVAQSPLGLKARLLAVFLAFATVGLITWFAMRAAQSLIEGPVARTRDDDDDALDLGVYATPAPVDEPRRPIFADRELGAPFMSDEALTTAARPLDLAPEFVAEPGLPVETVDEAPIVLTPPEPVIEIEPEPVGAMEPPSPEPELAAPLAVEEFDLPATEEPERLPGESSIDALIRRLESGLARRGLPQPPSGGAAIGRPGPRVEGGSARFDTSRDDDSDRVLGALRRMAG